MPGADGRTTLLSNGAIAGTASTLLLVPEEDLAVVCLTNTTVGNSFTDSVAFRIAGALLEGYSESLAELMKTVEPLFSTRHFVPDSSYTGSWTGHVDTDRGELPIQLRFTEEGAVFVTLDQASSVRLNAMGLDSGLFVGRFAGTIPMDDAHTDPQQIMLELKRQEDELFGVVSAESLSLRYRQPYYVEATKDRE